MIRSLVVMLWRFLANLNKSVRALIFRLFLKLFIYDKKTNSYIVQLNKVKFEVTSNNDLIITGFRFLEVDGELYFIDLKNKDGINKIKKQYFDNKIEHSNLDDKDFLEITQQSISKSYAKTLKTLR